MSANTIRNALGLLQEEADNEQAWSELRSALGYSEASPVVDPGELGAGELASLLEAARRAHEMRREYDAVAALLDLEAALATGEREVALTLELARVRDEILLDDAGAVAAYRRVLALRPGDETAEEAIERTEAKRAKWKELAQRYFTEAKAANDPGFRSSLLVSAAEIAYRYARPELEARAREEDSRDDEEAGPRSKRKGKKKDKDKDKPTAKSGKDSLRDLTEKILGLLRDAIASDAKNRRAAILFERLLAAEGRWDELAQALDGIAGEVSAKDEKVALYTRLARILKKKLGAGERSVAVYEKILDLSPGNPEATRVLADHFTEAELWDHLVALYVGQLEGGGVRAGQEGGIILQIAMVNWRMRQKPDAAEPYFERLRRLEPAHPGMVGFFREWCAQKGEQTRLVQILTEAQRALPDGPERAKIAGELAQLAEEGANAQKAIEHWRTLLRSEPENAEAREALKRLYRTSGSFNHLADLLRSELEHVAPGDGSRRLPVLREIAQIYRENIKSDSALVTVLSQIISLDPMDATAVRELARVYEALGRWRDLLTTQMRLAELEPDEGVKAELYRAAGRRWLEQFQNVQNAVEAYERLRAARPDDPEAIERLKELYGKRRAYRQLYELHEYEAKSKGGAERRALWAEMARMASDRLDRGADSTRLYKMILAEDPDDAGALDSLEKQSERDRDYATVAEVLERRVSAAEDHETQLAILQRLGAIYSERLADHAGALRVWRRVLDLSPGHAKALRVLRESHLAVGDYDGLSELYASADDWEGLAEVLSQAADRAAEPAAKIDLSFRVAALFEEKLGAPERALRSYERVLSVKPDDRRAAAALAPLYERDERWARLPALYEVLLAQTSDTAEQRALLDKLARVSGERLSDRAAALRYARKSYELAPDAPSSLETLERFAREAGDWGALLDAMQARLDGDVPESERRQLRMKLAEISAVHAGRPDDAIGAYKELVESTPDDEAAVGALDRLLRSAPGHEDDLRWLFRLRVERAAGKGAVALLAEWALLEEEAFGAPGTATDLYEELLRHEPEHAGALRSLSRLLVAAGQAERAAAVLQRERDLQEGETRAARELDLARLYLGPLREPVEALASAERALALAPADAGVIGVLEELLPLAETRRDAAALLEAAYERAGRLDKQAEALMVLLATAVSKQDRLPLHAKLAAVKDGLGDRAGAFDVLAAAALDAPAELEVWDRLSVLANKTGQTARFVETIARALGSAGEGLPQHVDLDLSERAATLYDENLGDIDRATPYLERILARDPASERAFARLKQILTTRERWSDLERLYERTVAATSSPEQKTELLSEVALVAEEITGEPAKAIGYYEQMLAIEPGHEQAMFALDKLYAAHERWQELAALLRRRLELAGSGAGAELKRRLGTLLFTRLGDPKGALDQLEEVVSADPASRDALLLVEKCLDVRELRQRAAIILEGVYADRDEVRDLVRVLEVRLEFVTDEIERRELLRRIAELRDGRLTDDLGAFETYGRLVPLSPADVDARQRFLEVSRRLGRLDEAAAVLLATARRAEAPQPRAEILADAASIHEERGETERCEAIHREVLALAPEDATIALPAARALERIYVAAGRTQDLLGVLRTQLALEDQASARRELLGRIAWLAEESIGDDAGAIAAWRQRLDDDATDGEALAALDQLYVKTGQTEALVEILRARGEAAPGAEQRRPLMVRTAKALESLGRSEEAIVAYRALLDDFGADREVLTSLAALHAKAGQPRDLVETLEAELALAAEPGDRVALLTRIGDVRRDALDEKAEALEAYRQALAVDPASEAARAALEALLSDEGVRGEAAEVLRPLYEATDSNDKLLRVLDIQIEREDSVEPRLDLLARAASVCEGPLADAARAFGYAARGLHDAAGEPSIGAWVERVERLGAAAGAFAMLVELFRKVAPDVLDEERQVAMHVRVAELARDRLADAALAKESYRRALERRPDDASSLVALEALHEQAGEHESVVELAKRRAELSATDDDKRAILAKVARVCDEGLADRDRAIDAYEQILELGPDAPATAALERLYAAASRWGDLVELHERELALEATPAGRRATLHWSLGRIYGEELGDAERAFDAWAEALRVEPTHEATVRSLEAILGAGDGGDKQRAARAAEMLEAVYVARLDWRKVMGTVEARLAATEEPEERRELLRRLAKLHEEQEENYRAALDVTAKLLAEDITDESTWTELERLARVASAEERLAEIFASELEKISADEPATVRLAMRTAVLLERGGEASRALGLWRRAYAFAPEERQDAFAAVDRLLGEAGWPAERVALYRDALEYRTEVPERVATLHEIARIEETELGDAEAAAATLESVLDADETDADALEGLARLYTRRERWADLADLHRRRAEQSALPEEEARWRLELATVRTTRLDDASGAIDELESVIHLVEPGAGEAAARAWGAAVAALEAMLEREAERARAIEVLRPIYEQADDWKKLVELAEHRYAAAQTPLEKVAVLRDRARLLEERGGDRRGAFDALREAFALDPDDGDTRDELDRVAITAERWDDLADAYEQGIAKIDGVGKRELLEALARLHDKRRDDPRRALDAWERLFALDEADPRPLGEMDQLATLLSDWPSLVRVLAKRAELSGDDEERASLWRRIGEARRDMLEDPRGAIDAYERALEVEPDSAWTIDNLIPLYEARSEPARLVDLYRRRVELCAEYDDDLKHQLLLDAARCYEVGLQDRREAVALLGQALATKPNDLGVMNRLSALYEAERMWPDLLDNLRAILELTTEQAERLRLTGRIGRLYADEIDDPARALDAFREVLASGYDEAAAGAVRRIAEAREEHRRDAIAVLVPVLRDAGRHAELRDAYELRLRSESEPGERAATLREIARVSEAPLGEVDRALDALLRAVAEQPSDEELHLDIARLATLLGKSGWARYADTLQERASSIFDATITADLFSRLGAVAEAQLEDLPRAAEAFTRAAEQGGDDRAVLVALERLHASLGDTRALADVLERRIGVEAEPAVQADLYHRLATLQIDALGDKAQGLGTLRLAVERVPAHEAARAAIVALLSEDALFDEGFDVLEGVYRATGQGEELARLYERRVDRASEGPARTRARLELARVREEDAADPVGAQRAAEAAVLGDVFDVEALAELERLAGISGGWRDAAVALGRALEGQERTVSSSPLWARLGTWQRDRIFDTGAAEQAYARALEGDPENIDLVRGLEELQRGAGRERERVATLRRLARLEGEPDQKRELARDAAQVAEATLADPRLAEEVLRDLLAESEADAWALAELTRLREGAGDHGEVVTLLLRRAELADGTEALALRHRAAAMASSELRDAARAATLYEAIFEQEPADAEAQAQLRALYTELGRWPQLGRLLTTLVDMAESPADRAALRVALARVQLERFESPGDAVETLRAILDEEPDHDEAVGLLGEIYERQGRLAELAELETRLVERARARGDVALEVARLGRLGETLETRVKDARAALETFEQLLEREPHHRGALEGVARLAEQRASWDKAERALAALLEMASGADKVAVALRLAAARKELGDEAGVESALRSALEAEPSNTDVRARLGDVYERREKWADLAELLAATADVIAAPHPEGAAAAPAPIGRGSLPPATSAASASAHVAERVKLLRRAAELHIERRRSPEDAVPVLERASELVPADRELLVMLADAYGASGRDREAASAIERAIASFGGRRTKEVAGFHHRLARVLVKLGDKAGALAELDRSFKSDPGSVEVLRDLGVLALESGELDRAQRTFRALLLQKLDAQSGITKGEVFCYLGEVSAKQGDKAKAVQMLERALENEPGLERAKALLGELKG